METKARHARTNDLGTLRNTSMLYVLPFWDYAMPTPDKRDKTACGFHNIVTTRMLCPQVLLREFDSEPEGSVDWLYQTVTDRLCTSRFCDRVIRGNVEITHKDYLSFLYDADEADQTGEALMNGLFKGLSLVHVHSLLFQPHGFWWNSNT